jgi:Rap1a immunity proteins
LSAPAQTTSTWQSKRYHSLMDGNQLYAECQQWQKDVTTSADGRIIIAGKTERDLYDSGTCYGYILGVVDSIPADEGFDPDPNVLGSQYIDVVIAYLRNHPQSRNYSAYGLTREALTEAFHQRANSK